LESQHGRTGVYVWPNSGAWVVPREAMDLRKVESVGIGRARKDLYDILRRVQGGSHYLLLRFDRPVAALVSHADYLAFSELARKDALARAVLQGKGYDPTTLSVQEFLDILAAR
jgi:antitoxin (DNA-binding transcriptional repressor) of toxin-antitoxin stability system